MTDKQKQALQTAERESRGWWDRILKDHPELRKATQASLEALWAAHAVSPEVGATRPYTLYGAGDMQAILETDPSYYLLSASEAGGVLEKVRQRPGVVMARHGVRRKDSPLLAQYRPFKFKELGFGPEALRAEYDATDEGVFGGWNSHNHEEPVFHYHLRAGMWFGSPDAKPKDDNVRQSAAPDNAWGDELALLVHIQRDHPDGAPPLREPHKFEPQWWSHIGKQHNGAPIRGKHKHPEFGKYQYAPGEGRAKGLDVHPMAWSLLEQGGNVAYVAMEGCLKNDAILSTGAPVVSVGSVTLWKDPQWLWLTDRYLKKFLHVVVVPDSDWIENSVVRHQVWELVHQLETFGNERVAVAAPPQKECLRSLCPHEERRAQTGELLPPEEHKRGVDDWLAEGSCLEDMYVAVAVEEEVASPGSVISRWRESRLLQVYYRYADPQGVVERASAAWAAERSGLSAGEVRGAMERPEAHGEIAVERGTRNHYETTSQCLRDWLAI